MKTILLLFLPMLSFSQIVPLEESVFKKLYHSIGVFGITDYSKVHYREFMKNSSSSEFKEKLQKLYVKKESLMKGYLSPQFTLTDTAGKKVTLTDLSGKIIYMDFWASWCGACIEEIDSVSLLKNQFLTSDEIVFLYISVDKDREKWKNAIKKYGIKGLHLIASENDNIIEDYAVVGYPTYFLIDKYLKFFASPVPRPTYASKEKLRLLIEEGLKQE